MISSLPEMPVYPLLPITIESAKGSYVYDNNNIKYLDMYGGHAVASIGHCHPKWVEAISKQAATFGFYSNICDSEQRSNLASKLVELANNNNPEKPMKGVFFCNSGAEANENALTLARLYTGNKNIVSISGGFHGRTLLTLSSCGIENYRKLTEANNSPILNCCKIIETGNIEQAKQAIDKNCAAVIVEPVQGLSGAIKLSEEYLKTLRNLCDGHNVALIFDEVQCGSGRTGKFTAAEYCGVMPDAITFAKGLAGGFPIGAVLANDKLLEKVKPGSLGSTFGGAPLACAAANATLEVMEDENLFENVTNISSYLFENIQSIQGVTRILGAGFLIGIKLEKTAVEVRNALLENQKIITGTSTDKNILRLLPPLTLNKEEADIFINSLKAVL